MGQDYRHANTSVTLINYHFVWIPRRRQPVLVGQVAQSQVCGLEAFFVQRREMSVVRRLSVTLKIRRPDSLVISVPPMTRLISHT